MNRRSVVFRILICVGLSFCLANILVWIATMPFDHSRAVLGGFGWGPGFYWSLTPGRVRIRYGGYPLDEGFQGGPKWIGYNELHSLAYEMRQAMCLPTRTSAGLDNQVDLILPLWLPFAIVAFPSVALLLGTRRSRRPGRCGRCNYKLTNNVSGRCPECGEPIPSPAA